MQNDMTRNTLELQVFMPVRDVWVKVSAFCGVSYETARGIWRGAANATDLHCRLIVVGEPSDSNVLFGSISSNPIADENHQS